jgi:uncharacterized membrane protein YdbT with pleckstrin-like domain
MHSMGMNLSAGEDIVFDLHPHWSRLAPPVLVLLVTCLLAGFGVALIPHGGGQAIERWILVGVAVIVVFWFTVLPYLRWLTTRYVLTTDRLVIRTGILARHGRDVPLNRINDVSFSETLLERMLRSGTLMVESAGERGQISLDNVPRVERVQRELYRMVEEHQTRMGRGDDDQPRPPRGEDKPGRRPRGDDTQPRSPDDDDPPSRAPRDDRPAPA